MHEDEFKRFWSEIRYALGEAVGDEYAAQRRDLVSRAVAIFKGHATLPSVPTQNILVLVHLATAVATTAAEVLEYADLAAVLADRCDDRAAVRVAGCVAACYANASALTSGVEETRRAADSAARFAARLAKPDARVDEEVATGLRNLASEDKTPAGRRELAGRVRAIASRHAAPSERMDEQLAATLANHSACFDGDATSHLALVREVEATQRRHPESSDIASSYALALWGAWEGGALEADPRDVADQLEQLAPGLTVRSRRFDESLAQFLDASGLREIPWEERQRLVARLERLASSHSPPSERLDRDWARAVATVKLVGRPETDRHAAIDRCAEIAARHDPPSRAIDGQWACAVAFSVTNASKEAGPWREALERVSAIATRHPSSDDPDDLFTHVLANCRRQLEQAEREL